MSSNLPEATQLVNYKGEIYMQFCVSLNLHFFHSILLPFTFLKVFPSEFSNYDSDRKIPFNVTCFTKHFCKCQVTGSS